MRVCTGYAKAICRPEEYPQTPISMALTHDVIYPQGFPMMWHLGNHVSFGQHPSPIEGKPRPDNRYNRNPNPRFLRKSWVRFNPGRPFTSQSIQELRITRILAQ